MREPNENDYRIPGLEDMHGKDLAKMAGGIAAEMEKSNEYPRLTLDDSEIQAALKMDEVAFSDFLSKKGIDFKNPVMLITPSGTAEAWMKSPEDIMGFLRRKESRNLSEGRESQEGAVHQELMASIDEEKKIGQEIDSLLGAAIDRLAVERSPAFRDLIDKMTLAQAQSRSALDRWLKEIDSL